MTKNWAVVEEEIRELAGPQKKEVEEIKRIMKSRGFDACTSSYRKKLKEWGLLKRAQKNPPTELSSEDILSHMHSLVRKDNVDDTRELLGWISDGVLPDTSIFNILNTPMHNHPAPFAESGYLFHVAASYASPEIIRMLVEYGAEINATPSSLSYTPLAEAVCSNKPHNVQALLELGADVNKRSYSRLGAITPLHQAVLSSQSQQLYSPHIFRLLLEHGADIDAVTYGHPALTALHIAIDPRADWSSFTHLQQDHTVKLIKNLLEHGANTKLLRAPDDSGMFAGFLRPFQSNLFWYRHMFRTERTCLKHFVESGADLSLPFKSRTCGESDTKEVALLHEILFHTPGSGLAMLFIQRADCRSGGNGEKILHTLLNPCVDRRIAHSDPSMADMIKATLKRGADPNLANDEGDTPFISLILHSKESEIVANMRALLSHPETNPMCNEQATSLVFKRLALLHQSFRPETFFELTDMILSRCNGEDEGGADWLRPFFPITSEYDQHDPESELDLPDTTAQNLPSHVWQTFKVARFSLSGRMFLDHAITKPPSRADLVEISKVLKLRKTYKLPEYALPQKWMEMLLDMVTDTSET